MTTRPPLARLSRRLPPLETITLLVVALLLFLPSGGSARQAAADGIPLRSLPPTRTSTIEGTVSAVNGTVLDVIGGHLRIDVANAKITQGDGLLEGPLPAAGIPVGAHVIAQVVVPDAAVAVVPPPPLEATTVVVFLPRDGVLAGTIQGVDVAGASFSMLFHSISTNAATRWSGAGPNGPVEGISDLAAGMFGTVTVVYTSSGLIATGVQAFGTIAPPHLIAFHGPVQTIGAAQWQIDGRLVQVNARTKIVGDPKVGDTVDVLAEAPTVPPGVGTAVLPVALSIIKTPVIVPPGPVDHATEFDGVVESIPPAATAGGAPLGHWKISSRDVVVNGLTKLESGIVVGTAVHVRGAFVITLGGSANPFLPQFVALEIRKR